MSLIIGEKVIEGSEDVCHREVSWPHGEQGSGAFTVVPGIQLAGVAKPAGIPEIINLKFCLSELLLGPDSASCTSPFC